MFKQRYLHIMRTGAEIKFSDTSVGFLNKIVNMGSFAAYTLKSCC